MLSQRFLRKFLIGCLCAWLMPLPSPLHAQSAHSYLRTLQDRAAQAQLANRDEWHSLVHYVKHPISRRLRSLADDADFFNARLGKVDPQAELAATLAAFFDPRPSRAGNQPARCRFIARWRWLRDELNIDEQHFPKAECATFNAWRNRLNARSISMIFPAAYVNSPASMYGHTFLRVNQDGLAANQPLLSYAISYAADGNESEGFMFALKGLGGFYRGSFTNSPYYLRIRSYSNLENRDIWEYELSLHDEEIDRLLEHAWELGFTRFDYYFFDENCSYHLLSLLDVARPGLKLTKQFTWWAIPVDTLRAITETPGLMSSRTYRPSNGTQVKYRASQLTTTQVARAKALSLGEAQAETDRVASDSSAEAQILELAERHLTWRASRGEFDDDGLQKRRLPLLVRRAQLPNTEPVVTPVPSTPPEAGHRTSRIETWAGVQNGRAAAKLGLRAAYHDLMDPDAGYQRGAQIQFFNLVLAQRAGNGVRIDQLTLFDVLSLSPSDTLLGGTTWKARLGLSQSWGLPWEQAKLVPALSGGPGIAWELRQTNEQDTKALAYAFMDNQLAFDRTREERWALGTGINAGVLLDWRAGWRLRLDASERHFVDGSREQGLALHQRISVSRDTNLTLRCEWARRNNLNAQRSCMVGWQRYF